MQRYYLDSSAAFKLVVTEAETAALSQFLSGDNELMTSRLTLLEVGRAVRRAEAGSDPHERLRLFWQRFDIQEVSVQVFVSAEQLAPPPLRSLDAIQLASALAWGADLTGIIAYDRRLLEAAEAAGLRTWSPR